MTSWCRRRARLEASFIEIRRARRRPGPTRRAICRSRQAGRGRRRRGDRLSPLPFPQAGPHRSGRRQVARRWGPSCPTGGRSCQTGGENTSSRAVRNLASAAGCGNACGISTERPSDAGRDPTRRLMRSTPPPAGTVTQPRLSFKLHSNLPALCNLVGRFVVARIID